MATCFVSVSNASPCKASSGTTEVSIETATSIEMPTSTAIPTTIQTTLTISESEIDTATSTILEEATTTTVTDAAASTTQSPPQPNTPEIDCSTDQDCFAALGAGALGIYACIDLICHQIGFSP
ncbi:hypothetical protein FPOAC2_07272 [Fusarium poae]